MVMSRHSLSGTGLLDSVQTGQSTLPYSITPLLQFAFGFGAAVVLSPLRRRPRHTPCEGGFIRAHSVSISLPIPIYL
jgi:hypothetical protein